MKKLINKRKKNTSIQNLVPMTVIDPRENDHFSCVILKVFGEVNFHFLFLLQFEGFVNKQIF